MVGKAAQPAAGQQAIQRGGATVQAQGQAQGWPQALAALAFWRRVVAGEADADAGVLLCGQYAVQLGVQRVQQHRGGKVGIRQQADIEVVVHQPASPNTPPRIRVAITKCCCSGAGATSFSTQLSSRV
ncbi:hypothetical protein D3C85_1444550 [compost metagenome]